MSKRISGNMSMSMTMTMTKRKKLERKYEPVHDHQTKT